MNENYISELIEFPKNKEEALEIQKKWRKYYYSNPQLIFNDISQIQTIAGVDVSFPPGDNEEWGISCAVLWNLEKNDEIEHVFYKGELKFPYIPGLLAFKEAPLIARAINKLSIKPDLIMFDGHGILHPKRFGEALHLGFAMKTPSIGVAKKPFHIYVEYKNMEKKRGNRIKMFDGKDLLAYVSVLADNQNPVFISPGYGINVDLAYEICLKCTKKHKQPEPLYLADQYSREEIKKEISK